MAFEVGERAFLLRENFKTHHTLYKHKCVYLAWASLFFSLEFWLIVNDVCVLIRGFFFRPELFECKLPDREVLLWVGKFVGEGVWGRVGEGRKSLHRNHNLLRKEDPKLIHGLLLLPGSSIMLSPEKMCFLSLSGLYLFFSYEFSQLSAWRCNDQIKLIDPDKKAWCSPWNIHMSGSYWPLNHGSILENMSRMSVWVHTNSELEGTLFLC